MKFLATPLIEMFGSSAFKTRLQLDTCRRRRRLFEPRTTAILCCIIYRNSVGWSLQWPALRLRPL